MQQRASLAVRVGERSTTADPSLSMSSSTTELLNTTSPTSLTLATKWGGPL